MGEKFRIGIGGVAAGLALGAALLALPATAQTKAYNPADAGVVANALRLLASGNTEGALALRAQAQDPAAKKLIAWYAYSRRAGHGDFAEIAAFIKDNPHWPALDKIAHAADRSIALQTRADLLLAWYATRLPETGDGLMEAVAALKAQGKAKEAVELLRRAWARIRLTDAEEAEILKRHGDELRSQDHAGRIGHLASLGQKRLAQNLLAQVKLEKEHRAAVEARLKLRDDSLRWKPAVVEAALAEVPAAEKQKEGFLYDLMRWHRRGNRPAQALAVAAALPAKLDDPEHWWKEFDILIRDAIARRQYDAAYNLARHHRQPGGERYVEAEFLAGLIAFRLMMRPDAGEAHFAAAAKERHLGWETARLDYWRGRAAEARGDKAKAREFLARAAAYASTFHGQLAAARLGRKELKLDTAAAGVPEAKFWGDELVRAAHLLRAAGDARGARAFAMRAAWNAGGWSLAQHAYIAKFAQDLTAPDYRAPTAVRFAKLAGRDGASVTGYGFPTLDLPEANAIEPALVFAVIRQESEFLAAAKSHAGARGLMQLMPFTAKTEAHEALMPFVLNRLIADPVYNLRLGTQHLLRLRDLYQGSYPLMIAAYNAGSGRVDRWLAQHGDPRKGKIEWADWIELIPFEETRLYTKLVLENHAVYRLRLGDKVDLTRLADAWQAPPPDAAVCNTQLVKEDGELLAAVPLGAENGIELTTDTGKFNKGIEGRKKPGEIPVVHKDKPDNRTAGPAC
ncbi:MAG TPA: lytic transglycosylase domain-containing protein [Alphaproteobacteria bacterium]